MKKVIITGATGFIGAPLVKKFIENGYEVYAVIRPQSKNRKRLQEFINVDSQYSEEETNPANAAGKGFVRIVKLAMDEIQKLPDYVDSADYFIHTAWEGIRGNSRMDEAIQQKNYDNSITAAAVAEKIGCTVFLGVGSQAEYGLSDEVITENTLEQPNTEYGKIKLAVYRALCERYRGTRMRIVWGRVFSAYGHGDTPNSLIETCMRNMRSNEEIALTECVQDWNFIDIDDVIEALYLLSVTDGCEGAYNIASEDNRSLKEYVLELKKVMQSDSRICFGAVPYGAEGPVGFRVNIEKLCNALQWKPQISFAEGIRKKIRIEESYENN